MAERRVVLTGAAGSIGTQVVPLLLDDPGIAHVYGIDVAPPGGPDHPKWTPIQRDIRDSEIHKIFQDADCLVHLAFVVRNIHDDAKAREINLGGTENLLKACEAHSVSKVVFTSSVAVYGFGAQNMQGVKEDAPLRPDTGHVYSACKADVERRLLQYQEARSERIVCILRPSLVVGPDVNNSLANLFRRNFFLSVQGTDPIVQAIHVRDMASAILSAVKKDISGVFNVGPEDAMSLSDICRRLHIRRVQIPRPLFLFCLHVLHKCRLSSIPPQSITRFLHSVTVDSNRFQESFLWKPAYSTLMSIAELRSERK